MIMAEKFCSVQGDMFCDKELKKMRGKVLAFEISFSNSRGSRFVTGYRLLWLKQDLKSQYRAGFRLLHMSHRYNLCCSYFQ